VVEGIGAGGSVSEGDADAVSTMASWIATAKDHGEEFQEDDWIALVQELARRVAAIVQPPYADPARDDE
jgi:hypothetical protein